MSLAGSRLILVGPGRAGSSLARSWTRAGGTLAGVVGRSPASAAAAAARLGAPAASGVQDSGRLDCDVLVLAVPDDRISEVAGAIAPRAAAAFAYHVSGALPGDELGPLRRAGAALGSLHPLSVFTGSREETWRNLFVAVEGDPEALAEGERIARALGARPHRLERTAKPLYHASASLAAGGTAALISVAMSLWRRIGLPEEEARRALARLSRGASEAAEVLPLAEAFTGPIARRDLRTVAAHAAVLRGGGPVARLYGLLGEEILRETPGRGSERAIRDVLSSLEPQGDR